MEGFPFILEDEQRRIYRIPVYQRMKIREAICQLFEKCMTPRLRSPINLRF